MPVEIVRRGPGKRVPSRQLKSIARTILELMGENDAELSLALVGNAEMQSLNTKYRHKNYPTDVLSFPVEGVVPKGSRLLGDVIISVEKTKKQAKDLGRSFDQELVTLLIHGIVHLLGYDHERSAKDARAMGRLEKRIYRQLCEREIIKV